MVLGFAYINIDCWYFCQPGRAEIFVEEHWAFTQNAQHGIGVFDRAAEDFVDVKEPSGCVVNLWRSHEPRSVEVHLSSVQLQNKINFIQ